MSEPRNTLLALLAVTVAMAPGCTDRGDISGDHTDRAISMAPACWNPADPATHYVDVWDSTDPDDFRVIGYTKVIRTAQTGWQHYDYRSVSSHASGVALDDRRSNLWVHENSFDGDLTFGFAFARDNSQLTGYHSELDFRVVDSDSDPFVSQSDDPGEAREIPAGSNAFRGDFRYGFNTDGIAVSGLSGTGWTIIVDSVDFGPHINEWRAASGERSDFTDDVGLTLGNEYRLTPACSDPSGLPVRVEPPVAICEARVVEADASCLACASIDGGSRAGDGGPVSVDESPGCDYALGDTLVTLTATDELGESASCSATVSVVDGTAPDVSPGDTLFLGFPRSCDLEDFSLADCGRVADNCDGDDIDTLGTIVSISSDEEVFNAQLDCDSYPEDCIDVEIVDNSHFRVRNTRASDGDGRVYTVRYTVADSAGNSDGEVHTCQIAVRQWNTHVPTAGPAAYTVVP